LLLDIVQTWVYRIKQGSEEELKASLIRARTALDIFDPVMAMLLLTDVFLYPKAEEDDVPATVCLSGLIREALSDLTFAIPRALNILYRTTSIALSKNRYVDTYVQEMVAQGWCPFAVHIMIANTNLTFLEYASHIEKPA